MAKLNFKERQNLYEEIRMDTQEKREWEEVLEVKITSGAKRRIECFEECVEFIEDDDWGKKEQEILDSAFRNIANEEINERIQEQNMKASNNRICVKCGKWIQKIDIKEENSLAYCPYCWEVCFGRRDANWPPKAGSKETKRGFHAI